MNSWRKQRKACLISLVLAFALAACDSEPEQKSQSAAPQDSITENQTITNQPTQDQAETNPPADNQETAQQDAPAASSGTTSPEPHIVEGITGEEPTAGGRVDPARQLGGACTRGRPGCRTAASAAGSNAASC